MTNRPSLILNILVVTVFIMSGCVPAASDPVPDQGIGSDGLDSGLETLPEEVQIKSTIRGKDGMVQLALPGGTFLMGSTDQEVNYGLELCNQHYSPCNQWFYQREYPQHEVIISPFWIDQNEITNEQYRACVESGNCSEPMACKKGEPTYQDPEKNDHPVVCVSWEEASNYCSWVGGRLPSEAEWEYAFRGEESFIFPWGDDFIGSNLNYCDVNCEQGHADPDYDDGYPRTAPVGSFPEDSSWAGLEDLSGNVSEWVRDWSGDFGSETLFDPVGPETGTEKLIKGCGWFSPAAYCRGSSRPAVEPDTRYDFIGFRCAQDPSPIIDGILEQGEWDRADKYYFEDGSELLLIISEDILYLAIQAGIPDMIAGNVFLQNADQIKILHTSAALGTAVYQDGGEGWNKIQDFEWCCRARIESEQARIDREDFFDQEGWLGINSFLGNQNELEYKIQLSGRPGNLAVNFLSADNPGLKLVWPEGIVDGPAQPVDGGFPDVMEFAPQNWFSLKDLK